MCIRDSDKTDQTMTSGSATSLLAAGATPLTHLSILLTGSQDTYIYAHYYRAIAVAKPFHVIVVCACARALVLVLCFHIGERLHLNRQESLSAKGSGFDKI